MFDEPATWIGGVDVPLTVSASFDKAGAKKRLSKRFICQALLEQLKNKPRIVR